MLTIELTAAQLQAVATDKLTISGGVENPSLSTPALPISAPVAQRPLAGPLSLYRCLACLRYTSLNDKQVVPRQSLHRPKTETVSSRGGGGEEKKKKKKKYCEAKKTATV